MAPGPEQQLEEQPLLVELRCEDCNYGVSVREPPARCPMCGGRDWVSFAHAMAVAEPASADHARSIESV
jgi:rubrerythrin